MLEGFLSLIHDYVNHGGGTDKSRAVEAGVGRAMEALGKSHRRCILIEGKSDTRGDR